MGKDRWAQKVRERTAWSLLYHHYHLRLGFLRKQNVRKTKGGAKKGISCTDRACKKKKMVQHFFLSRSLFLPHIHVPPPFTREEVKSVGIGPFSFSFCDDGEKFYFFFLSCISIYMPKSAALGDASFLKPFFFSPSLLFLFVDFFLFVAWGNLSLWEVVYSWQQGRSNSIHAY